MSQTHGLHKLEVFLPYSLNAWSSFNARQQWPDWKIEDVDVAVLESLAKMSFLMLD